MLAQGKTNTLRKELSGRNKRNSFQTYTGLEDTQVFTINTILEISLKDGRETTEDSCHSNWTKLSPVKSQPWIYTNQTLKYKSTKKKKKTNKSTMDKAQLQNA